MDPSMTVRQEESSTPGRARTLSSLRCGRRWPEAARPKMGSDLHWYCHGLPVRYGDGKLEFGVIHDRDTFGNLKGGIFRCYDLATGTLEWELEGVNQTTDVVTADVDGDGRPEFIAGLIAIKAVDGSHGRVLWEVPLPFAVRSPVIGDVDGDGRSEIVLGCSDGKVRTYK